MGLGYYNEGPFTLTSGEALAADRLVKMSTTTAVYCDAANEPIGITQEAVGSGESVSIMPINASGIAKVTASKAISAGSAIYPANDGKVSDAAGGGRRIGTTLAASTADGGKIPAIINTFSGDATLHDTSVVRWTEDFITGVTEDGHKFSETADKADWLKTSVDGDTDGGDVCKVIDGLPGGGILQLTCNDADADGENLQLNGEAFRLTVGKPLWFEAKAALLDVDKCNFFIGLAATDTEILGGVTDRVGFYNSHDGNLMAALEQDATDGSADSTADIADCAASTSFATYAKRLGFFWDGVDTVTYYVDGVAVKTLTDNGTTILVPDDVAMSPAIQIVTHTSAAAVQTAWIDYIDIVMVR